MKTPIKATLPEPYMTVQSLPAVMCEDEIRAFLRLPQDFLRTWLMVGSEKAPAIPHFQMGQRTLFPTERVLAWLAEFHGYGYGMADLSRKPKAKRKQPGIRAGDRKPAGGQG